MAVSIGTNIASLQAQRRLGMNSEGLARTSERLSSGQRINRASDDAAGLAVASALTASARVFSQAIRNVNDGISLLNIADGALQALSEVVVRGKELAEQAANGTYSATQRKALDRESKALTNEFNRVLESTSFNGVNVFASPATSLRLQAGYGIDGSLATQVGGQLAASVGSGAYTNVGSYAGIADPNGIDAGDLDGDGDADLAFANSGGFFLSVLLNNGDGSFKAKVDYALPVAATGELELYDVNNDSILDMVSAQVNHSTISVHLGNGNGSFKASTSFATGATPSAIDFADFNGDGLTDLVVSNRTVASVSVLFGAGDGSFSSSLSIASGSAAVLDDVAVGDFNGDGRPDFVLSQAANSFGIFLNQGGGTFTKTGDQQLGAASQALVVHDFDDDGTDDVASAGIFGLTITLGNGDGKFRLGHAQNTVTTITKLEAGDLNEDGILDLFAAEDTSDLISIYVGNADGTFKARSTLATLGRVPDVALADFNADGVLDIAASNYGTENIDVYRGASTLSLVMPRVRLRTQAEALEGLGAFDSMLSRISLERGSLGALQSRLEVAIRGLSASQDNYLAAAGRISDADVAQESANLVRYRILQEAAAAVLSQANLQPQLALQLLK